MFHLSPVTCIALHAWLKSYDNLNIGGWLCWKRVVVSMGRVCCNAAALNIIFPYQLIINIIVFKVSTFWVSAFGRHHPFSRIGKLHQQGVHQAAISRTNGSFPENRVSLLQLVDIIALHCHVVHLWVSVVAFINIHYCLCKDMVGKWNVITTKLGQIVSEEVLQSLLR